MIELGPVIVSIALFVVLLLGAVLLVIRTTEYQNRPVGDRHSLEFTFIFSGWMLIGLVFLCFGLVFCLLPFIVVYIYLQNLRVKQQGLLWMMAIAAERKIPLAPAVAAYAREVGGFFGSRVDWLATLLHDGVSLPNALNSIPLLVSQQHYPIIYTAFESGALAQGLRKAAAADDSQQSLWGSLSAKILYIAGMMWFGSGILTFVMIKIVPAYEKIFKDFGTRLPSVTLGLLSASSWFVHYWFLFFPVYILFIVLFGYSLMKYVGLSLFELPGVGRLIRRKHTAAILENLALTVENQRSIDAGIQTLIGSYPVSSIRGKLNLTLTEVRSGAPWGESLLRHGLIRQSDLAVLQAAERAGNLPWAMRELADSNRRRLSSRLDILVQTIFPPVVLCFGAMVLFIVVALFLPLITLIRNMS